MPDIRSRVSEAEWQARTDLAAVFRLAAKHDLSDLALTHFSARIPDEPDRFLLNPYGLMFEEITASSLVKTDREGGDPLETGSPLNAVGILTARDKLSIQWTKDGMRRVAEDFGSLDVEEARIKYRLRADVRDWKVADAQQDLKYHPNWSEYVKPVLYRPFDTRYTYYTGTTNGFLCYPRPNVMYHMLAGENCGLLVSRNQEVTGPWRHVLATTSIADHHSATAKEAGHVFPLYLYPEDTEGKMDLGGKQVAEMDPEAAEMMRIEAQEKAARDRTPNLSLEFLRALERATGMTFEANDLFRGDNEFHAADVFAYIYGILHSPSYRERYADFLKSDFPRIPLPPSPELFRVITNIGHALVRAHVRMAGLTATATFPVGGDGIVDNVRYVEPQSGEPGRAWINKTQYFEGVSPEVWEFSIGGYRPAEKWLKDRKGRKLEFDDIAHYQRICAVLAETGRLMAEVDAVIERHGGWPLRALSA